MCSSDLTTPPTYPSVTGYNESRYDGLQKGDLTWKTPITAGSATAATTDSTAVVMFAQNPAAPTGLSITQLSQAVTGIGLDCSALPQCIPTGIAYNHVSWGPGQVVCDTFSRTVTGGWDIADTGQLWTTSQGNPGDYFVEDGVGKISMFSAGIRRQTQIDGPVLDGEVYVEVAPTVVAAGAQIDLAAVLRRGREIGRASCRERV